MIIGFPVLRLRGDYLAIVTLAFGEIIRLVLINWVALTNGFAGIQTSRASPSSACPSPRATARRRLPTCSIFPAARPLHRSIFLYYVILALALLVAWRDAAHAPAAGGARVGGLARGRDRLPLARHQYRQHQALGVRDGRALRRPGRRLLRRAPGLRQPALLRVHGIGDDPGDRRAGRDGLARRRRRRRRGDDRRHRAAARARLAEEHFRRRLRPRPVPHAHLRPRHGADDGLAPARPHRLAPALDRAQRGQGRRAAHVKEGRG